MILNLEIYGSELDIELGRMTDLSVQLSQLTKEATLELDFGSVVFKEIGGGGIPEAPADNKLYGRKNKSWVEVLNVPAYDPGTSGLENHKADLSAHAELFNSKLDKSALEWK